jgi:Fungal specific transcription factor domain
MTSKTSRAEVTHSIQKQMSLLDQDVVVPIWDLIDLYYVYLYPINPIIPKSLFLENIWNECPVLLLSMYALASRYRSIENSTTKSVSRQEASEESLKFYKQARNMIDRYLDNPSIQIILALRLLGSFAISLGEGRVIQESPV